MGGILNISYSDNDRNRKAFDVVPGNMILNYYAEKLGKQFDENGDFAKKGNVSKDILEEIGKLEFFKN
jgi:anhydro-N-acetylmuramic acid kinase